MYLTKINKKTGLIDLEDENDGVLAVKAFRDVLQDESLRFDKDAEYPGIHCFTAIALTVDYLSIVKFYSNQDRPKKAQEEVTGKREQWVWNQEVIQKSLLRYEELQYDPTIEEGRIHHQRKVNKVEELKQSEQYYGKGHKDENGKDLNFESPATVSLQLRKINDDIKYWTEQTQGKDIYDGSPVKNGYTLSRLEQKLEKKNSFYKDKR